MTNLVEITVKATDSSDYASIKAKAAKAGEDAADAFNKAFKLKADSDTSVKERLEQSGGVGGSDASLMNRLKSYANTPGGIGILGTGNDTSLVSMLKNQIRQMGETGGPGLLSGMGSGGTQSGTDMIREVLQNNVGGNMTSTDLVKQVLENNVASNTSTTDMVKEVLQNNVTGNVSTSDFIKQVLEGNSPGNVNTSDYIKQVLTGNTPGNISTTDTIKEKIDDTGIADQGKQDGDTYGTSFASSLKDKLSGLLGGKGGGGSAGGIGSLLTGGGGSGDAGAVSGALDSGGVAGGALPGVAGVSGMAATVTGLAGALVAVLPAITSVVAGLGAIGGGFAILLETSKSFKAEMTADMTSIEGVFAKAAAPLAQPLEQAATLIVGYFKMIQPELKGIFSGAGQLVQPLVEGFLSLTSNVLPGFTAMLKSAGPVFATVGQAFADLGKSLGTMFQDFASDGSGSATILKGFLDIINSLLPFIGELGKIMVSALAPAFSAFSGALSSVLPALSPLMSILGSFAGAVLTDLGGVLGSVGTMLVDLAPSFTLLAKVASSLFNTLENTGVFAILGNALESLAGPIANLVNALVKGLAPALPGVVSALGKMAGAVTGGLTTALGVVADALTAIVKAMPPGVMAALVDGFVAWKTATLALGIATGIYSGITGALTAVKVAFMGSSDEMGVFTAGSITSAVTSAAAWVASAAASVGAFVAMAAAATAAFIAENIATLGIVAAAAAVIAAVVYMATHWTQTWDAIKQVASDVGTFLGNLFNNQIVQDILAVWSLGLVPLAEHWSAVWNDIESAAASAWKAIEGALESAWNSLLSPLKSALSGLESAASSTWGSIKSTASSVWNSIWSTIEGAVSGGVKNVENYVGGLPGDIKGLFSSAGSWLTSFGGDVITGFWSGLKDAWDSVVSWFKGIPGDILSALGIHSPPDWAISAGKDIMSGLAQGAEATANKVISAAEKAAAAAAAKLGSIAAGGSGGASLGGSAASNAALMEQMAAARGWQGLQWSDLYNVEMREAGFSMTATNQSSGAYGMAQFIGGPSEYATYGGNSSTAAGQITGMLNYIAQRYGNPQGAWAHEQAYGWYANGGPTSAGWSILGEQGPELVKLPGGATVTPAGGTAGMVAGGGNGPTLVQLEVSSSGQSEFDDFMSTWIKNWVRIKGGGQVQKAFGR